MAAQYQLSAQSTCLRHEAHHLILGLEQPDLAVLRLFSSAPQSCQRVADASLSRLQETLMSDQASGTFNGLLQESLSSRQLKFS